MIKFFNERGESLMQRFHEEIKQKQIEFNDLLM